MTLTKTKTKKKKSILNWSIRKDGSRDSLRRSMLEWITDRKRNCWKRNRRAKEKRTDNAAARRPHF
jgi:hypothetical protein